MLSAKQIDSKKLAGEKSKAQKFFDVKRKTEVDTGLTLGFL